MRAIYVSDGFVHPPDVIILNWKDDKSSRIIFQQRFIAEILHGFLADCDIFLDWLNISSVFFVDREVLNASQSHCRFLWFLVCTILKLCYELISSGINIKGERLKSLLHYDVRRTP